MRYRPSLPRRLTLLCSHCLEETLKKAFSFGQYRAAAVPQTCTPGARAHVEYRHSYNPPADSMIALSDGFQGQI